MQSLFIGTSGYSYKDWEESFYPAGTGPAGYLNYYSMFFDTVEINSTYYFIPNASMVSKMESKTKDGFIFSIKAHSSITHTRDAGKDDIDSFKKALIPLKKTGKIGALLFQFPYSFKFCNKNLDYLKYLKMNFEQDELVMEFRNKDWLKDAVLNFLQANNIGFCNVDEPELRGLIPRTDILTSDSFYLRFHGRNKEKWWNHKQAYERYDYMYKAEQLQEWVPAITKALKQSKKTLIYFNNHYKAKSVRSAEILKNLLLSE
ncbi:MAG: DUF72 domain-containing protein [Actinomycetota bacterium]|nr:DUF72 domain-containing protein [Actinomycetota bacterium]